MASMQRFHSFDRFLKEFLCNTEQVLVDLSW